MHTSNVPRLLFAVLLFLFYGPLNAAAVPALLPPRALSTPSTKTLTSTTSSSVESRLYGPSIFHKRDPKDCFTDCIASTKLRTEIAASTTPSSAIHSTTHPASSSTNLLGKDLCTRATVTVISTEISVSTKTHTVTERIVGPTRLGADKREACIDCTPLTKPHSTSTKSSTTHKKTTAPDLAITRRVDERAECTECLTAGIIPALLSVKTTSAPSSTASTTKSTKRKTSKTSTTTSFGIAHSIHFDRRTATALPGHAKLEDSPTHGQERSKCVEYIGSDGEELQDC